MRSRLPLTASIIVVALCLGVLGSFGGADRASASDPHRKKKQVDAVLRSLRGDLSETTVQLRDAALALRSAEARLPGAQATVARVRGQLAAAQARDAALGKRLDAARAEVAGARRAIRTTQAHIAATRRLIGRIARSSYQQGDYAQLAVVLQSDSPDDFATRLVLVQDAMRSQGAALGDLGAQRADLAAQRATLVAKRQQLTGMKQEQERLVARVARLEGQAVVAQQRVQAIIAQRAGAVATIERQKAAEEARYRAMQAESRRLQRVLAELARKARIAAARAARATRLARLDRLRRAGRAAASSGGSGGGGGGVAGGGVLSRPAFGPVTSPFGMRVHPVTGVYKLHDGTDFGVACGTPVHAAAAGTVVQAANVGGYGNQLVLDDGVLRGAGVATSYNHLERFAVGAGAHVGRGQLVGWSGGGEGMDGAGFSTGCHLHFMVYVNGVPTDPMHWL